MDQWLALGGKWAGFDGKVVEQGFWGAVLKRAGEGGGKIC